MNNSTGTGSNSRRAALPLFHGILPLTRSRMLPDILAGITLAAMNIPQAMGYTKIAGTPVVTGLYTLLLPVLAFAVFGASRYLVVAADSATATILAVGVAGLAKPGSDHYLALASTVALLTAGYLLVARVLKLGFLSDFLSRTVLIGFLTGVGVQVSIAMLGQMLGIQVKTNNTAEQFHTILKHLMEIHWPSCILSTAVIALIFGLRYVAPKLPGAMFAIIGAIALSAALDLGGKGVALIGPVAGGLPRLGLPDVSWEEVYDLLPIAGACFVMVIAQSSVTARAYAVRHRQSLDENRDLLGLFAADAAAGISGTFVVNGSPTQTAMVEASGGRSQLAHIATAATVTVVLLFLTGPLKYLPLCVLGAVVFVVALGLIDARGLRQLQRRSPREFVLALITAAAVIFLGVERGILLALVLSLLQHIRHTYQPPTAVILRDATEHWRMEPVGPGKMIEPGLVMFWFGADLYYANSNHFVEETRLLINESPLPVKWLVIDAGAITAIDFSASRAVQDLHRELSRRGIVLALTRVNASLNADLEREGLRKVVGINRIFMSRRHCIKAYRAAHPELVAQSPDPTAPPGNPGG
jgi:high affinity sulfate transporter 1